MFLHRNFWKFLVQALFDFWKNDFSLKFINLGSLMKAPNNYKFLRHRSSAEKNYLTNYIKIFTQGMSPIRKPLYSGELILWQQI